MLKNVSQTCDHNSNSLETSEEQELTRQYLPVGRLVGRMDVTGGRDGKSTDNKRYTKIMWCILTCSCIAVVIVLYEYQFKSDEIRGTRSVIESTMDEDSRKVVDGIVKNLKKHRGESKAGSTKSLWQRLVSSSGAKRSDNKVKLVLIYTGFFGHFPWGWLKNTKALNEWNGMTCPHYHCRLTYNKNEFKNADAVIFHAQDMVSRSELNALQLSRTTNQRWVFFPTESPQNVPEHHMINGMFNWTMSYRRDSDIFRPYGFYYPIENQVDDDDDFLEYLESKDLLVVWLSSHPGMIRDKYVRRLRTWIKVNVYGTTGARVGGISGKCQKNSPDCTKHLKRFKFILAFENSFCTDYITEKYWFSLQLGIVPVVMGGAEYRKIAIPGSYINVKDFSTIKALADYLRRLDKNDREYNKYFDWRRKYKVVNGTPWSCQLCAAMNMDLGSKVYDRLKDYWSAEKECGIREDIVKEIIARQPWNATRKTRYEE